MIGFASSFSSKYMGWTSTSWGHIANTTCKPSTISLSNHEDVRKLYTDQL